MDLKSTSVSAEDIDAMIAKINGYADRKMLDPGLANSLVSKLENAKKTWEREIKENKVRPKGVLWEAGFEEVKEKVADLD